MSRSLTIVHLYPSEMNTYEDTGNVKALMARLEWRGLGCELFEVGVGQTFDFRRADIIFAGGGQDRAQVVVGEDLLGRKENLHLAAADGVVMLVICGTYQLFGERFLTHDGELIPGIGIFAAETTGSPERMIGDIVTLTKFGELVGFENHSGKTRLGKGQTALGKVLRGFGNDGSSGEEGAAFRNVHGTYMHGPVLPKNPRFADGLLGLALERKYSDAEMPSLEDELEEMAAGATRRRTTSRRLRARAS